MCICNIFHYWVIVASFIFLHLTTQENNMVQNDFSLLIGVLLGFIFTLAAAAIIISLGHVKLSRPTTLGDLRKNLSKIQDEVQAAQERIWDYGRREEEKSQRWRINCTSVIGKSVSVLQSCWYGRNQDSTYQHIYNELLVGLKSVGLREIRPNIGQEIEENDRHYRINKIEGVAPFVVSKLLCPGYYFKPETGSSPETSGPTFLEPALIEVKGKNLFEVAIVKSKSK
jgi:hypothetical protein